MPSRHLAPRSLRSPSRRAAHLCICAVLALALAGTGAPAAMSAGFNSENSFGELTEKRQETRPTQTTTTTSTESTTNSSTVVVLALAAAVALLIGIAFVIVRDARKVAPVTDGQLAEGGSVRDSAAAVRRRRAKAKAARRQRKRNR